MLHWVTKSNQDTQWEALNRHLHLIKTSTFYKINEYKSIKSLTVISGKTASRNQTAKSSALKSD